MKRYTKIALSTLLIMTLFASAFMFLPADSGAKEEPTRASTLYVGSDQTYKTIKSAMNAASSGDTIRIYDGIYHEPLTISKSLTFQGNGSSSTIVNQTTNEITWWITVPDVVIRDIGFEANRSFNNWAIRTSGYNTSGSRITILRCSFKDSHHGISFHLADGNKILDSTLVDTQIHFGWSHNNIVKNISIKGGIIQLDSSENNLVEDCVLTRSTLKSLSNIQVIGKNNMVKDCLIYDTQSTGIQVVEDSNIIIHNTIYDNDWGGILLSNSDFNWISNNTIKANGGDGIQAFGSCNNTIMYNDIEDNDEYGVNFKWSAWEMKDNEVVFNNFIRNGGDSAQATDAYEKNTWYTMEGGNYWSDNTNFDLNNDFFADFIYILDGVGGAKDRKPFVSPLVFPNAPVLTTVDNKTAYTNQNYSVQYEAFDWDTPSSNLKWTMNTNASWLTFTSSHELKGVPKVTTSSYWVNISVSDGEFSDFTNFTLNVINQNVAPAILTADVPICLEDQPYEVDYEAEDTDDLIWELFTDAPFLSIERDTGVLFGIPTNDDVGTYSVSIIVSDEWSYDTTEFTLEVINTNDAPTITSEDILTMREGEVYFVDYEAEDIDPTNDVLEWSMLTNCPFLVIDEVSGALSGTAGESDAGIYEVQIIVSDGNNGMDISNFELEVQKVNNAPSSTQEVWMLDILEDGSDSSMNVHSMFSDVDGDDLQYTISHQTEITWTLEEDGRITFEPSDDWTGIATITVTADDGEFTVSSVITIEVSNVNDPPTDPVIDTGSVDFKENETQIVTASAMDIDKDEVLSYEWSIEGMGVIGTGETIDLDLPAGNYTLVLKVTDSSGSYTTTSMRIEVLPVNTEIPTLENDPEGMSLLPYIIGASLLLVVVAFALSIFFIRKRSIRSEDNREGMKAWNQTFSMENGPTPQDGMTQGTSSILELHRLDPPLGPANTPAIVNGGRLGELEADSTKLPGSQQDTVYFAGLMEEILGSKTGSPTTEDLTRRLELAREMGDVPEKEYREIIQRLNNIDKYGKNR